jgi:hypothetical protein
VLDGIFQRKIYRERPAGILRAFIFWAFVFLFFSVAEIVAAGYIPGYTLPLGPLNGPPYLGQDLVATLGIVGVLIAVYRRTVSKPNASCTKGTVRPSLCYSSSWPSWSPSYSTTRLGSSRTRGRQWR